MSIKDRINSVILKGIPFGGLMIIYDYLKTGEISWVKFGIMSLIIGLVFSYTDPIVDFKMKDLFSSKSDLSRLIVFVVLGQIIALILMLALEINSFAVLFLASCLLFIGSHKTSA